MTDASPLVIQGRRAVASPESKSNVRADIWIPGSRAALAPRNDKEGYGA